MRLQILLVLSVILVCNGIKVPIDRSEENVEKETSPNSPTQVTYYVNDEDDGNVDSYLIPPNPYTQELVASDKSTPATYLLPPSEKQAEFFITPEEEQTDWLPIAQNAPSPTPQIAQFIPQEHTRRSKSQESKVVPVPSLVLEPPRPEAQNEYFVPPNAEQLPLQEVQRPVDVPRIVSGDELRRPIAPKPIRYEIPIILPNNDAPNNYRPKTIEANLPLHLIPPQRENYKVPTKLYPKKYGSDFKPVPIPIAQYIDGSVEIPRAKPAKLFKPLPASEIDYLPPTEEKINYLYRKAEHKIKLKGEELSQVLPTEVAPEPVYSKYKEPVRFEQETSESIHRHPGRNVYPAPLRQPSPSPPQHDSAAPAPDERTEFRMHGMKGPHSYQFGFDTGKGKNRQFRYEERDNEGNVQGHYGYMDKHGKLRVVNYTADPAKGFHAEAPVEKEE